MLSLLLAGCGTSASTDATDANAETPKNCVIVAGAAPFGVELFGTARISPRSGASDAGSDRAFSVRLFFPKGRVAGAPVLVTISRVESGFTLVRATLDSNAGLDPLVVHSTCWEEMNARLVGPTGGVDGTMKFNVSGPSTDAIDTRDATFVLCDSRPVPETAPMKVSARSPLVPIEVTSTVPIDTDTLALLKVRAGTMDVKVITHDLDGGGLLVQPVAAFPVFEPLTIDVSLVRDATGRSLPSLAPIQLDAPKAVVTDLTFDSSPPVSSIVGGVVSAGKLIVKNAARPGPMNLVVGLGSRDGMTKLRVRHRHVCAAEGMYTAAVAIVGADGSNAPLSPKCSDVAADEVVSLKGGAPYVLAAFGRAFEPMACSYPFGPELADYEIEEIAFEK